jgi:hypothetical protein
MSIATSPALNRPPRSLAEAERAIAERTRRDPHWRLRLARRRDHAAGGFVIVEAPAPISTTKGRKPR